MYKDIYLTENDFEKEIKQEAIKSMEDELELFNKRKVELNDFIVKLKRIDENKENLNKIIKVFKKNLKSITQENKIELIKEFVDKIVLYESWKTIVFFKFANNSWDDSWWSDFWNLWEDNEKTSIDKIVSRNDLEVNSFNGILGTTISF